MEKSSCAASCSTCCRRDLCASATSDSSPTATAPRYCHSASNCSAAHRKTQLRRHRRPQKRLIHSGTAQSAAEPCASSNGSPLHNSCFALHLNQTSALHEALSISSAFARASARLRTLCPVQPTTLRCQSLQPPLRPSPSHSTAPSGFQTNESYPTQSVPDPPAPAQAHSKYIGFHGGGFLQVAVSEAPRLEVCGCATCVVGRSRYSTKTFRSFPIFIECSDGYVNIET